jgi:hypothetical protein
MLIQTPISIGELIDKISILEIKKEKINSADKLKYINEEYDLLIKIINKEISFKDKSGLLGFLHDIKIINQELWEIEDKIREKESKEEFDIEFIALARSVYQTNDERFRIKNEINKRCSSNIQEQKSYKKR